MTEAETRAPRRGPYSKSASRRKQIIDQALPVFDELGFEATSLRAIAETIGVTHPVLVHHFGTKEQLFLEVLRAHELRFTASEIPEGEGFADSLRRAAGLERVDQALPEARIPLGEVLARVVVA